MSDQKLIDQYVKKGIAEMVKRLDKLIDELLKD